MKLAIVIGMVVTTVMFGCAAFAMSLSPDDIAGGAAFIVAAVVIGGVVGYLRGGKKRYRRRF